MIFNILNKIHKLFPFSIWIKDYRTDVAIADLVAGITIGLTLIPQSIAYASLAGLSPEYGLYSSLCGGIIYVIFGTTPQLNIAPTALLSLLTFSYTHHLSFSPTTGAILLCFLSGIIELLCGFLHLGFLLDFVSTPVVAAFTSAGAITIASSQIKNLLGLKFSAESFASVWKNVYEHILETRQWDAILGFTCCIILFSLRKLKDYGSPPLNDKNATTTSTMKKIIWFISVARNAFVVIACSTMAYFFERENMQPFSLTSKVPSGLPQFHLPFLNDNSTISTAQMINELGTGVAIVPFIAILGNVAIAKAFANGKVIAASQEMIAVGMCNLFGSFFGSYPVNASFSRAAVSNASGVRTPLAGIYAGILVILALTFLTPYFSYIPKATLASIIICAVIFMVEVTMIKKIWQLNKIDLSSFAITLVACLLLGIEIGILIGIATDLLSLLYRNARPTIKIDKVKIDGREVLKVTPSLSLLFPNIEYIRKTILSSIHKNNENISIVMLDCQHINRLDFTAMQCIIALVDDIHKIHKEIIFYCPNENVSKMFEKVVDKKVRIITTKSFDENMKDYAHIEKAINEETTNTGTLPGIEVRNQVYTTPL